MGGLSNVGAARITRFPLRAIWAQSRWESVRLLRMLARRLGPWGGSVLALSVAAALLWWFALDQQAQVRALTQQRSRLAATPSPRPAPSGAAGIAGARGRMRQFEQNLLPHEEIPQAVQDVLRLAEREGLPVAHGEYRAMADNRGGFMRYQMNFAVAGKGAEIDRFVQAALVANPSLALESIQFKREHMESDETQARVRWSLLTRLPAGAETNGAPAPAGGPEREAR